MLHFLTHSIVYTVIDELDGAVRRLWDGGESHPALVKEPQEKDNSAPQLLVPFPDIDESKFEVYEPVSPLPSPRVADRMTEKTPERSRVTSPSVNLSPHATPPPPVFPASPTSLHSLSTADDNSSSLQSLSGRGRKDGLPTTPSSRRRKEISSDITSDQCMSIITMKEGAQKHGKEFFEYLSDALLSKDAPIESPGWPSLQPSPSYESPCIDDRWLLETNYRAAVTHQALVWDACLGLLNKMNDAAKDIELERCVKLNSMLLVALPLERRMLLEMREVHESVVQEFLVIRHDKQHLSDSIDGMIDRHARLLRRRDSDHKSFILNKSRQLAPDLTNPSEGLEPEGTYGITHQAMVVERSVGLRSWKCTLAVVTIDRVLHLFDISFVPGIAVGSSATEAFDKLLPDDDFPEGVPLVPRKEKLLKYLSPITTVNLRNCCISSRGIESIEVTETYSYVGLFRDKATRRFFLRGESEDLARCRQFLKRIGCRLV